LAAGRIQGTERRNPAVRGGSIRAKFFSLSLSRFYGESIRQEGGAKEQDRRFGRRKRSEYTKGREIRKINNKRKKKEIDLTWTPNLVRGGRKREAHIGRGNAGTKYEPSIF